MRRRVESIETIRHDVLARRAAAWLEVAQRCTVVFVEGLAVTEEVPDAIGFRGPLDSILVECKASRADFLADRKKSFRIHPELGMGRFRFYFAPTGMIHPRELPDGWGLVECTKAGGRMRHASKPFLKVNRLAEQRLLFHRLYTAHRAFAALRRAMKQAGR